MIIDQSYINLAQEMLEQLPRGAFLIVKNAEELNTMTIAWGSIGYMWRRPILMVLVRYSRHTYDLMEEAEDFTVSFPYPYKMRSLLNAAGSTSGRDIDKFQEFAIKTQDSRIATSPAIADCNLIFECKTLLRQPMDEKHLAPEIKDRFYSNEDYHVLYFGEILTCYRNQSPQVQ